MVTATKIHIVSSEGVLPLSPCCAIQDPFSDRTSTLRERVHEVVAQKLVNMEIADRKESLSSDNTQLSWWRRNVAPLFCTKTVFVLGDLFNVMCLAAAVVAYVIALPYPVSLVLGVVAGGVNMVVGAMCVPPTIPELKKPKELQDRDLIKQNMSGLLYIPLGIVMALSAAPLGAFSAFFAANPWVIPLLFFMAALPTIKNLYEKLKEHYSLEGWRSTLNLDKLEKLLKAENFSWDEVYLPVMDYGLSYSSDLDLAELDRIALSNRLEEISKSMGVETAVAVFDLWHQILKKDKEAALGALKKLQGKIEDWENSLWLRVFQQACCILAMIAGGLGSALRGLSGGRASQGLDMASTGLTGISTAIALRMDADYGYRYKRNVPRTVDVAFSSDAEGQQIPDDKCVHLLGA